MDADRGMSASEYPAAWRHLNNIFTVGQASKVRWVWTLDVRTSPPCDVHAWYPGDKYVDVLEVDGYNLGHDFEGQPVDLSRGAVRPNARRAW